MGTPMVLAESEMNHEPLVFPRPSGVEWLCLGAGLFLVMHYAWLLDDAFVYFRYVDNWVLLDRGLVYNPGEYAEGYTSPAWLLLLAGLRALGMGLWVSVCLIGVFCFAAFWVLGVLINRELSPAGVPSIDLPIAFLSVNYAVLCYFTSGTESPLVQLSAAAFVLFALRPTWAPTQLAMPLLPLVRPELALALIAALVWFRLRTGRLPWRMGGVALLVAGGWLLFRIVYYADLFPTTFYLKNLVDVRQGLLFLHDSFQPYHVYELALLGMAAIVVAVRRGVDVRALDARAFVWLVVAAQLIYTVKIGGDPRHYRYLAFPVPAAILCLGGLPEGMLGAWGRARRWAGWAALGAAVCIALLSFSFFPRQLARHPAFALDARGRYVDKIADAAHHRLHRDVITPAPWTGGREIELRPIYAAWKAAGASDPPTSVRVEAICYPLYMYFYEWAVQGYGLTDAVLARVDVPAERPAHKEGLRPLAADIQKVLRWHALPPEPGMYRAAVEAGVAAAWMERNLETLERLERKLYNRHDFFENLALALRIGDRIDVSQPGPASP